MTPELQNALNRLDEAWAKDQTKHYLEMFNAIGAVLRAYNDWKLAQPLKGTEKAGRLKKGNYSFNV